MKDEHKSKVRHIEELEKSKAERKPAEKELRETRDYLEKLIEHANSFVIVCDPEFRITRLNRAAEHLSGYRAEEVLGQELHILFPEAIRDEWLNMVAPTLNDEHWDSLEIPILHKNGDIRIVLWNSANIYAKDGKMVIGTIAQGQDITKRKQAEEALRQRTYDLGERVKELNCLYGISELINKQLVPLEETLQEVVELIPPGWQYPEITCARINSKGQVFSTKNCKESSLKLNSDIIVGGERVGELSVGYLEERPESYEGPFLKEERNLIDAPCQAFG